MNELISKINNNTNYRKMLTCQFNMDNYSILKVLKSEGVIKLLEINKNNKNQKIINFLINDKLGKLGTNVFLKPISKPGRKVYISNKEILSMSNTKKGFTINTSKIGIKTLYSNLSEHKIYLLRTSSNNLQLLKNKGIITQEEAIKNNVGGELLLVVKFQ